MLSPKDVESVVKASQALSSEIVLPRLIDALMRLVVEQAGANRGVLVLVEGDKPQIDARATAADGKIEVSVRQEVITPSNLPDSALHFVIRTRERVILDDATVRNPYSDDEYMREKRPRSVLCLPLVTQTKLVGALYLENNLTPGVFTSDRVAVLELLASQAAISLENARLYSDLQRDAAFLDDGRSISETGSYGWSVRTGQFYWSDELYRIYEFDRALTPSLDVILDRVHPDDRVLVHEETIVRAYAGQPFDIEHRLLMPDGRVKHLRVSGHTQLDALGNADFVGAAMDITSTKQAALIERTRIAQELHDTLLQGFTGIALQLRAIDRMLAQRPQESAEALKTVLASADITLRDARRMIWDMRAVELEGQDLATALEAATRSATVDSSASLVFSVHGDRRRLPVAVETTAFRIGREAVINAVKHAAPSKVEVDLEYGPRSLTLRVVDDGIGIAPDAMEAAVTNGHLGVIGMRDRARRTGGTLSISSEPGKGTVVSVSLRIRETPGSSTD